MLLSWSTLQQHYVKCNYGWDFFLFFCHTFMHKLHHICKVNSCLFSSLSMWLDCVSCHFKEVVYKWTLSCLIGSIGVYFCVLGDAQIGRRMPLWMKTMRRRKCCIYAVHGLLSSLTGGNKPCWRSARLGLISLTGESAFSEALSVLPVAATVCLKPEPQLCSYPEEPRHVPPDPQKCLLIWTEWARWTFC